VVEPEHLAPTTIELDGVVAEVPIPDADSATVEGERQSDEELLAGEAIEEPLDVAQGTAPLWVSG
jgi:hypothetical protein